MEYKDMLSIIKDIEGSSPKSEVSFIDISQVVSSSNTQSISYNELLKKIAGSEQKVYEEHIAKATQKPAHIVTSGLAQSAYSQPQLYAPAPRTEEQKQVQQPEAITVEKPAAQPAKKTESQKAKLELGSIVKKLGSVKTPSFMVKRVNVSGLVLPSLTLADQIAELERIIEGLKEGVFDKEHMEIVKEEVYGLNQIISDMKKKGMQPAKSELEKSLFDLRDQRLAEAMTFLKMSS